MDNDTDCTHCDARATDEPRCECGHTDSMHANGRVNLMSAKAGERPCLKGVFSSVNCACTSWRPVRP